MLVIILQFIFVFSGQKSYEYHKPTQEPIDPPYKKSVELRRQQKLQKPESSQCQEVKSSDDGQALAKNLINEFFVLSVNSSKNESEN